MKINNININSGEKAMVVPQKLREGKRKVRFLKSLRRKVDRMAKELTAIITKDSSNIPHPQSLADARYALIELKLILNNHIPKK